MSLAPRFAAGPVAPVARGAHHSARRVTSLQEGDRVVRRAVVDDDDVDDPAASEARHASDERVARVVVDDDRAHPPGDVGRRHPQAINSATRSVIGCSQPGSGSHPRSRSAALSRTELAGRGAGRGGVSSLVEMGSTRPGSRPAAPDHQTGKLVPGRRALVGDVEDARELAERELDGRLGHAGSRRRASALIVHETKRLGSRCQSEHCLHHVRPGPAAHPRGSDDRVTRPELALAPELRAPVDGQRVRIVPLDVRAGETCRRTRNRSTGSTRAPRRGGPPPRHGGCPRAFTP